MKGRGWARDCQARAGPLASLVALAVGRHSGWAVQTGGRHNVPGVAMPNCTFFGHLLAALRLRPSVPDAGAGADAGGCPHGTASALVGPQVNIDGTPMLNDALDVLGKP